MSPLTKRGADLEIPNRSTLEISSEVIDPILDRYIPSCRYLDRAFLDNRRGNSSYPIGIGEFSIKESYYTIGGKGPDHFNATEFILCFNQLGYVFIADMTQKGMMPELNLADVSKFREAQMSRFYIGRFYDITFKSPIKPDRFYGRMSIEKTKTFRDKIFYVTKTEFSDDNVGYAEGRSLSTILLREV